VLLAEDHTIVREGLRALLSRRDDVAVVGEAGDGHEALREALRLRPDVVVMDLGMPGMDGVEATREVLRALPTARVLVLSMHGGEEHVRPALRAGATGFLLKGSGLSDLVAAIRAVAAGERFYSPSVAAIAQRQGDEVAPARPDAGLTPREREVLCYVAEGLSSSEIAAHLALSVKTVETHRSRIMTKLGAPNSAALVRHAIRLGLVSVED
jgi:DNA-binding NarL/FixJ family response regulator